jgi:hypothetical protein
MVLMINQESQNQLIFSFKQKYGKPIFFNSLII